MPKKVITPSVHKNICQRLHRYDQQYLQEEIDTLRILIARQDNLRYRKWLHRAEEYAQSFKEKVEKVAARGFSDPELRQLKARRYMYKCIMYGLPTMLQRHPKLRAPHPDVSLSLIHI